jgi:prepilin-type N-terminal cleavage/methylation domain-containing protein
MRILIHQKDSKDRSQAFTLVEILVATAVLGVMFLSLYVGVSAGFGIIQVARENLRATQILQEKMETIRLYTWDQITTTNFVPNGFTEYFYSDGTNVDKSLTYKGTVSISPSGLTESYSNDVKKVNIKVTWASGKITRSREMKTFVSTHGLQFYIY